MHHPRVRRCGPPGQTPVRDTAGTPPASGRRRRRPPAGQCGGTAFQVGEGFEQGVACCIDACPAFTSRMRVCAMSGSGRQSGASRLASNSRQSYRWAIVFNAGSSPLGPGVPAVAVGHRLRVQLLASASCWRQSNRLRVGESANTRPRVSTSSEVQPCRCSAWASRRVESGEWEKPCMQRSGCGRCAAAVRRPGQPALVPFTARYSARSASTPANSGQSSASSAYGVASWPPFSARSMR